MFRFTKGALKLAGVTVGLISSFVQAQDANPELVEAARLLSSPRSEATFIRQCTMQPARFPGLGEGTAANPVQLFDNLYYVGRTDVGAWVIETSDGLALIDTLYTVEDAANIIIPGMRELGLDPDDLRVVFVSHFHGDHSGGSPYFLEQGIRVMLSETDWEQLGGAPDEASIARDGQVVMLGETPIRVVLTPGHTPGAISLIFPVFDGDERHVAVVMELSPRGGIEVHEQAVEGILHLAEVTDSEGADVALHPHEMIFDPVAQQYILGGAGLSDGANPLVIGEDAVHDFAHMVATCWRAKIATLQAQE